MKQHQYILEPYKGNKTRHQCPACNKAKTFTLYIDTETSEQVHSSVGRCNREDQCGYHYSPKQYFIENGIEKDEDWIPTIVKNSEPKQEIFIAQDLLKRSLAGYENNNLIKYLISIFDKSTVADLTGKYFIGTSKHWLGASIFYQIDTLTRIRRGKIMLYNPETGRRDKHKISSVHSLRNESDFKPSECFFGEHLLKGNNKTVAICESEKTALIASVYFPKFIWLASGGLSNLNYEKCKILKGRNVILYPDLNGFDKWKEKAQLFLPGIVSKFIVSDLLENVATDEEKDNGLDIADYLLRYKIDRFNAKTAIEYPKRIKGEQIPINSPESLIILLNELIEIIPENMPVIIDFRQQACFKTFIKDAKDGFEKDPTNEIDQNKIRSIYRKFHKEGNAQFANKY